MSCICMLRMNQLCKRNQVVLNYLPGELHTKETNEKFPGNCKYSLAAIQGAQN